MQFYLNTYIKVTSLTGNKILNINDINDTKILIVNMCDDSSGDGTLIYYSRDGSTFTEIKYMEGAYVQKFNSKTLLNYKLYPI